VKDFIPHIHHIQEASIKLPEASLWPEDKIAIAIPVSGKTQLVHFERLKKSGTSGQFQWTYNGRIFLRGD
jgi:hypothetical protein